MLSAHQVGGSVEVIWGGSDTSYDLFAVEIRKNGALDRTLTIEHNTITDSAHPIDPPRATPFWARPGRGSGRIRIDGLWGVDAYSFVVRPASGSSIPARRCFR